MPNDLSNKQQQPVNINKKSRQELENLVSGMLQEAKQQGATSAEVSASLEAGFSVNVRLGEVETVEYNRDKGIGITVYHGQRKGSASTSDTAPQAIKDTVSAALAIAKIAGEDACSGLAPKERLAFDYPDVDVCYPWTIEPEQAIEHAITCEATGRSYDPLITNSEGVSIATHETFNVYGNSHGFIGHYPSTRHSIYATFIAQKKQEMQRDYYYAAARDAQDFPALAHIGQKAAQRTLGRLESRRLKTQTAPILFAAEVASGLIGHFVSAVSGSNLYRQASFLIDSIGQEIFNSNVTISEKPFLSKGLASSPFDSEGVALKDRLLVDKGVVQSYVLSNYSARKLGLETTGNAGGIHNLVFATSDMDLPALFKKMGTGFFVTELMGQGINIVTGEYSRGACGFWIENGEIQFPVHEVTIAGNLQEMFKNIVAIGNDINSNSHIQTGAILIDHMMIAGE